MNHPLPGAFAPATWWEWLFSIYNPDKYDFLARNFGITIAVAASTTNADVLEMTEPGFIWTIRQDYWRSDTGATPTFPVRTQILQDSNLSLTGGSFSSRALFGAPGPLYVDLPFPIPRGVVNGTRMSITHDNSLNSAPISVDTVFCVLTVLMRHQPVHRG